MTLAQIVMLSEARTRRAGVSAPEDELPQGDIGDLMAMAELARRRG